MPTSRLKPWFLGINPRGLMSAIRSHGCIRALPRGWKSFAPNLSLPGEADFRLAGSVSNNWRWIIAAGLIADCEITLESLLSLIIAG
jgi:hypothetical protein